MEITYLDFFLINILSYIAGLGTGLVVCCKNKDKFFSRDNPGESDAFQLPQPYAPPQPPDIIATVPQPEQINKGVKITLE